VDVDSVVLLRRVLDDLVEGQGNRAVTVDVRGVVGSEPVEATFSEVARSATDRGARFTVRGCKAG
jgi:hypothetical protein